MSLAPPTSVDSTEHAIHDFKRPIVNFSPSIWGNVFLQYDTESMVIYLIYFTCNIHLGKKLI